jgi:oligopeptide transport system substrate-binding protein
MNRAILAIMGAMAALVIAVGVVVVVLVSRGGGSSKNANAPTKTPGPGTAQSGGGPVAGQLRLAGPEPITLDPAVAQDADSAEYVVEIFGGLLTLDQQLQLQPDIAEAIPSADNGGKVVNADGTVTYTFHLRPDVLFQDRKPVTADTVRCSLERAADPSTQSLVADFFLGDIVGAKDKLTGKASEISGMKVIDPTTLSITITRDLPSFLYKLTFPTAFVVDLTQTGGKCGTQDFGKGDSNWTRHPNGTGPYALKEWTLGERIVLQANDHYHLGVAKVKTVNFLLAGGGLTAYESGDIDVTGVGLDDLERVQDPVDPLNKDYHSGSQLGVFYIGFNTKKPPFDDAKVRQAFAMAIDKQQIASAVLKNSAPVANSIMMPGLPGYNPTAHAPGFDPAQAKQLLAESKYGGAAGLPAITLAAGGTGATAGDYTSAIVDMWRTNLGVDVQIQQAESATLFQDIANGRYQMFELGWVMDYPDPEDILNVQFDSTSQINDTFYTNAQVDDLLRRAQVDPNAQERVQLYQQAEQQILDDAPWIPLFFGSYHVLIKPYVHGFEIPPSVVPQLRYISVESQ